MEVSKNIIGSNWEFHHVGVIVPDMDEAVRYYESLGIFTFQPEFGSRLRFAQVGAHRIELISPTQGQPIFQEFLDAKGGGMHHIAFTVDNLDAETAKLAAKDIPVITSRRRPEGGGIAFFDIRKYGGVIIELMQPAK
ncbi:MAG: VOC family protein [Chloroflexota bacterium]